MSVITRLFALYDTIDVTCQCGHCEGHEWTPLTGQRPRILKMRPVRYRHPVLVLWDEVDRLPIGDFQSRLNRMWRRTVDSLTRHIDRQFIGYTEQ